MLSNSTQALGTFALGNASLAVGNSSSAADDALPPVPVITPDQLQLGFRTVMAWGLFGALGLVLAWRAAVRELRKASASGLTWSHELILSAKSCDAPYWQSIESRRVADVSGCLDSTRLPRVRMLTRKLPR